jgi:hypothetical protein
MVKCCDEATGERESHVTRKLDDRMAAPMPYSTLGLCMGLTETDGEYFE